MFSGGDELDRGMKKVAELVLSQLVAGARCRSDLP
jgi:hypothetical protein